MTRIRRSWQGLSLLLGLAGALLLLSGQGCPTTPGDENWQEEESNTQTPAGSQAPQEDSVGGPAVQIIFPNGGERLEVDSIVEVRIFARHPAIPDPLVRVFYDRDSDPANGSMTIATVKASRGGVAWDLSGLPLGTYWIGAELVGVTPAVVDYCNSSFQIVPAGEGGYDDGGSGGGGGGGGGSDLPLYLSVTAPRNVSTLYQNRVFTIRWSVNVSPGQATAVVFLEPDFDEDGLPDGQSLRDVIGSPGIEATLQRLDFNTTGYVGRYFVGVTVTTTDGRTATEYSPGVLSIHSAALWVGDLGTKRDKDGRVLPQTGAFQGAILKGFNAYDNLGSAMLEADDYDDDGLNEIVVAAQFAKPFFFFHEGRGSGEAYMIYGSTQRLAGDIEINATGSPSLPGVIFTGITPNPYGNNDISGLGNPYAYTVDGQPTTGYGTEGLRSMTMIPDQDLDGKREIAFGFPWCDSLSLWSMWQRGIHTAAVSNLGRLENDGHFLRGGVVMVSSQNPIMTDRTAYNTHLDRYIMLHEVGQVFGWMDPERNELDLCPLPWNFRIRATGEAFNALDTVTYPCDGFWQDTTRGSYMANTASIEPPRLADPQPAYEMVIPSNEEFACGDVIDLSQVDPPPPPTSSMFFHGRAGGRTTDAGYCDGIPDFAPLGQMYIIGTGFYVNDEATSCGNQVWSDPRQPYGCRILGQTTTQLYTSPPTTANRFGASISTSNGFLLAGAPMRTPVVRDVAGLPDITGSRHEAGQVYLLELRRQNSRPNEYMWRLPNPVPGEDDDPDNPPVRAYSPEIPQPHNFIIDDLGYYRYNESCRVRITVNSAAAEMLDPIRIVGAAPGDRIGEQVSGLYDIDDDGVEDMVIGGPGTNSGRGGVYVLYRRMPGLEHDYLLDRVQLGAGDPNGQYGLFIIGEQGENLGTAVGGLGPRRLNDDYNNDGYADVLIGSPNATSAAGFEAGQVFVLFGGDRIANPPGGVTIAQLREAGHGALLVGAQAGDRAGEVVASAGDVNGDGIADFLISAPNATVPDLKFRNPGQDSMRSLRVTFQYDSTGDGILDATGIGIDRNGDGKADPLNDNNELDFDGEIVYDADDDLTNAGLVYLVFGGTHLEGTIKLDEIGTAALPGLVFVGRTADDELGAGRTQNNLLSRGLAFAGDMDGDGFGDLMISSVLADPQDRRMGIIKENAGEVYVIYGFAP